MKMITPTSLDELTEAVRATPRLLAVGAGTKPRLSAVDVPKLSTAKLSGIIEYDPGEFTFTALAGTPVRDVAAALAQCSQYLPFDPLLLDAGATLGGTVAAGASGPGRFRFGGIRDFILGVRFVDGEGRLLRMGGKVVKNAAGFDLPKFFVGSLGRFGVLAELTFKVFPRPAAVRTLRIDAEDADGAARVFAAAAAGRWQPDALDLLPDGKSVLIRLAGPEISLDALAKEVLARWPGTVLSSDAADDAWAKIREFHWAHADGTLIHVPLTIAQVPALHRALGAIEGARLHISAGGDAGFVSWANGSTADREFGRLGLQGLTLRGAGPLWCGIRKRFQVTSAVKAALDPQDRFPSLDEG